MRANNEVRSVELFRKLDWIPFCDEAEIRKCSTILNSKSLLAYYYKCCNLIGYATRYLFVNRYRVAASNATRPSFSQNKQCLFLVFLNNFDEITNTSLFLLEQVDYSHSISMQRQLTRASPSLTITSQQFRARYLIVDYNKWEQSSLYQRYVSS